MKFLDQFKRGLPNTFLANGANAFLGFFSGVILAHTLSPALRGEFAAILLWPGVLVLFGELGLGYAFSFYVGQGKVHVGALWTIACVVSLVWGCLLVLLGAILIPSIVHLPVSVNACLVWNLLTVPFSLLMGYATFFLLGSGLIVEFNMIRLLSVAIYSLGIVVMFLARQVSLEKYTAMYILSQVGGCAVAVWLVKKRFKLHWCWQKELLKPVFFYGCKTYLSSLAAQMNLRLDQLLMSSLVAFEQLGLYVVAVAFSTILTPLYGSLATVILPRVTLARDLDTKRKQTIRYVQMGWVIGIPIAIIAIAAAPWLLPFLFGMPYVHSVFLSQILLVGVIFQGSNIVLGNALRALGRPSRTAIAEGTGMMLTIVLLLWLLPVYGAVGAAATSLTAYATVTFMQLWFVKKEINLSWRNFFEVSLAELFPGIVCRVKV